MLRSGFRDSVISYLGQGKQNKAIIDNMCKYPLNMYSISYIEPQSWQKEVEKTGRYKDAQGINARYG
jgi:hypothetical protein